ncbi:TGF-beta-activated kinase 1 and MAP3K7-binding protein 2 isoform X2 [Harpegnathos saltator]|uniref:TGF-beta-activated kinase 1 and MAP3K7-binding protein 2 isoform X2 n=1 Tax=Harpegnathos saltator TaxID=610380 RepID=UPI000DBEEC56|nr:TGF-beta-activated kinase 1 and MAP3K7-binding protein 2 isoform X2 [Harpegnathos saltator]
MGECHCSNITIMQLFHELKQQFPALPDHVVSQCIAQNSHDRETCARSLRATQESRPSPGAFPPPAPCTGIQQPAQPQSQQQQQQQQQQRAAAEQQRAAQQRCCAMNQVQRGTVGVSNNVVVGRPHRPASLDIGMTRRCSAVGCSRAAAATAAATAAAAAAAAAASGVVGTPTSAPAACTSRGFFDDCTVNSVGNANSNATPGFELNVNVACSPADFRTVPTIGACKRSDLVVVPRPHYAEPLLAVGKTGAQIDHTRSYTSVSLTLRPPSSEPQAPIDIRSEGSSLTYSTSSLDPRGFQSRLQISIGPGNVGSVAAARIRPPIVPNRPADPVRPNSLIPPTQTSPQRPPGLPPGPPSQLPRPTTTMSAPTTPSVPSTTNIVQTCSLPTTPSGAAMSGASSLQQPPPSSSAEKHTQTASDQRLSPSSQVAEHQRALVEEQLIRKEKLAKELRNEKGRLEVMRKELQTLARPQDPSISQELKRKLKSEIYQLQIECDRLADEVDQWSDTRVPLGETNEEFYQGIYTGQPLPTRVPTSSNPPPPLPSQPPAWMRESRSTTIAQHDNDREERDGPSWVCTMCTFDNHPLMNKCEECDMPRLLDNGNAGMQRRVASPPPPPPSRAKVASTTSSSLAAANTSANWRPLLPEE